MLPISNSLVTAILGADYKTPRKLRKVAKPNGNNKRPMEIVLEARRLWKGSTHNLYTIHMHLASFSYVVPLGTIAIWCREESCVKGYPAVTGDEPPFLPIK